MVDILDKNIYQVGDLATELHPQSTIHKPYILASSPALQANKQKPVLNIECSNHCFVNQKPTYFRQHPLKYQPPVANTYNKLSPVI